jgi:hypothetical protein
VNWTRIDRWFAESDAGYRIAISRHGDGWVYLCFTSPRPGWREEMKVRYRQGESVPREREWIGTTNDPEAARAICERHWKQANAA